MIPQPELPAVLWNGQDGWSLHRDRFLGKYCGAIGPTVEMQMFFVLCDLETPNPLALAIATALAIACTGLIVETLH